MKTGRQIGHIQTAIIGLRSVWLTLFVAIISIWKSSTSVMTREFVDEKMRWWANSILGYVDLSFNFHNPTGFKFEPGVRYVIMCNHASHYDIPLTYAALEGSIRMIGKKEMFDLPIWGRGARLGEFISVDRSNREQALKDLDNAREKMESGIIIWIAPEGTRSRTGNLLPLKKGGFMMALETGAQIVPLGIRGAANVLPPGTKDLCLGCEVDLHLGAPIDASKYTLETRDQLIAEVERSLMELADVQKEAPKPEIETQA